MGRRLEGMDRPGVWQVPEGSGEQGKMENTGCKIICGAPTTFAVKGLMMMMNPLEDTRSCVHTIFVSNGLQTFAVMIGQTERASKCVREREGGIL